VLTVDRLRQLLSYDQITGEFRWLNARGPQYAGKVAGVLRRDGYREIKIDRVPHQAHRLAWLYVHAAFPKTGIDHINGIRSDNCLSNLREANNSQNQMNTDMKRTNRSGFKGVSWHKKTKKWHAQIRENGKPVSLGYFHDPEIAHAAYVAKANKLHGQFARAFIAGNGGKDAHEA
jgi:hypothetical protein